MITASSSPKRRIRTPEHGHAYGVGRYLLSRIGQAYGSGIVSFSSGSRLDAASGPGNSPKASGGLTAQRRRRRPGKVSGNARAPQAPPAETATATVNATLLLSVLVD